MRSLINWKKELEKHAKQLKKFGSCSALVTSVSVPATVTPSKPTLLSERGETRHRASAACFSVENAHLLILANYSFVRNREPLESYNPQGSLQPAWLPTKILDG